ncbi:MAG TPA: lysyl endopeptidase, partial [Flavobacteriales bacterium]|nr:lysyl endopeptidase [Flavobacteriales bacterium]
MKRLTPLLVLLALISTLNAQTTDLGNPIGWNDKVPAIKDQVFMPGFDIDQCQLEDEINDANKVGPWRFGYEFEVDLGLDNSGDWYQLPNGDRLWRLNVVSTGALTMNFIFDKYVLPEGAYLMLYPTERSYHHNAYTAANNNEAQVL